MAAWPATNKLDSSYAVMEKKRTEGGFFSSRYPRLGFIQDVCGLVLRTQYAGSLNTIFWET